MKALAPAMRLHAYLTDHHWKDGALIGPDPGIRFNYRLFRFVKSYLRSLPWSDNLYYLQAQGYWALANARLFTQTRDPRYREILEATADTMLARQQPDGAWPYPNPEWAGRVATAEGVWASIGLLEAFRLTGHSRYLGGALKWHRFMVDCIGYQVIGAQHAINYFASTRLERIPNNSAFALRFLAELADVTHDPSFLDPCDGMLEFLWAVQKPTGEIPYAVTGAHGGKEVPHFQCYQYNAFQCLDLMRYYELTGEPGVVSIIEKILDFLALGVAEDGHVAYECAQTPHTVTYHAAVTAATFVTAARMGFRDYEALSERAYGYVLERQREDGSFPHSTGDYRYFSDLRSYPRYLAMILFHLLQPHVTPQRPTHKEAQAQLGR
jgi:hypothetical protein